METDEDEIDKLMEEAQEHDLPDEIKREQASMFELVKIPVSRVLFTLARPEGARILFL